MCKKSIYLVSFVLVLGLVLTDVANAAEPGLVGWWKFEDEGTGTALDYSGNDYTGTLHGDPTFVTGVHGQALEFHGNPDYVTIDDYKGVLGTNPFSIAAWVKTTDNGEIVGWGNIGDGQRAEFRINNGRLRVEHGAGNLQGDTSVNDDEWHHVALTVKENAAIQHPDTKIYLDGQDDTRSDTDTDTFNIFSNYPVTIAHRYNLSSRWLTAVIDDVRIYDKELTQAEVQKLALYPTVRNPIPTDGATHEGTDVLLQWTPGGFADNVNGHHVYFGDSFDDVSNGTPAADKGLTSDTFYYVSTLVQGTTYYWRIDAVNDVNPDSPWVGDVWHFLVPPTTAWMPDPADGVRFIDPNVTLSWTAGMGAILHTPYFGDNFDDVNTATGGTPQPGTTYTPPGLPLALDKDYYWRVDECDGTGNVLPGGKGDVWTFRTMPAIPITDPNLSGLWTLDEGAGTNALDWSGHGNDGVLQGNPQWLLPGWVGESALSFDGSGDYVAIDNLYYSDVNLTEVSVCAWVRTTDSGNQAIVSYDRSEYWRFEINGNGGGPGEVGWSVATTEGTTTSVEQDLGSITRVDDGQWHHVTGVFDNGTMIIYINGNLDASAIVSGSIFGTGTTRYGFIASRSEASSFNGGTGTSWSFNGDLDDVRIYDKVLSQAKIKQIMRGDPNLAWDPYPANGSTVNIDKATPLTWSPGDNAVQHHVYFGTDRDAVRDANTSTTGIYRGTRNLGNENYTPPEAIEVNQTYCWRIDEYNTDDKTTKGRIWSFTVPSYRIVDNMESYADRVSIEATWRDGYVCVDWGDPAQIPPVTGACSGSVVDINSTVTYDGSAHSMTYYYDNDGETFVPGYPTWPYPAPYYSEIKASTSGPNALDISQDWTVAGVKALSLWFYGDPNNDANATEQMYVKLNGVKIDYDGNMNDIREASWHEWNIDLAEFGINLSNVTEIAIGFGIPGGTTAGGQGIVYFDNIWLEPPRCVADRRKPAGDFDDDCQVSYADLDVMSDDWLLTDYYVTVEAASDANMEANYKFEYDLTDSSFNLRHGDPCDPCSTLTYDTGNVGSWALELDGTNYVYVTDYNGVTGTQSRTTSAWIKTTDDNGEITSWGTNSNSQKWIFRVQITDGTEGAIRMEVSGGHIVGNTDLRDGIWHHVAAVLDSDGSPSVQDIKLYVDGLLEVTSSLEDNAINTADASNLRMGRGPWGSDDRYFDGLIDEVRIYSRALPHAQIANLAGMSVGTILHQPLHPLLSTAADTDLYDDEKIDLKDYALLANQWLDELLWP